MDIRNLLCSETSINRRVRLWPQGPLPRPATSSSSPDTHRHAETDKIVPRAKRITLGSRYVRRVARFAPPSFRTLEPEERTEEHQCQAATANRKAMGAA